MRYQILISRSPGWKGEPIVADISTSIDSLRLAESVWKLDSLDGLPTLEFAINTTKSLPDFISSGVFDLFSDRFIQILKNSGVLFESFPITLRTKKATIHGYQLFHLLQIRPIVDIEKSKIYGRENIEKITLLDLEEVPEFTMIRDNFLRSNVFVRDDLVKQIHRYNISGCGWLDTEEYSFHFRTKRW